MPLPSAFPFIDLGDGTARPFLAIKIINPETEQFIKTFGLIDTGADECALPAFLATRLGHNLQDGELNEIQTGNGLTTAYRHTTKIEIYNINDDSTLYSTNHILIDFMPNLHCCLLGVRNFLSNFTLEIDYSNQLFRLKQ